jgi:hypothetical protein
MLCKPRHRITFRRQELTSSVAARDRAAKMPIAQFASCVHLLSNVRVGRPTLVLLEEPRSNRDR